MKIAFTFVVGGGVGLGVGRGVGLPVYNTSQYVKRKKSKISEKQKFILDFGRGKKSPK